MITGPLKLGIAVGVGYTLGGKLGIAAVRAMTDSADAETQIGAAWAGRVVTFGLLLWVMR